MSDLKPKLFDATLWRNLLAMIVWQGSNYLIPLLTFPYLTRVLGPEHYGMLGFSTAIVAYCLIFSDWGFSLSASRSVATARGDPALLNGILWNTLAAKGCLSLCSLAVLGAAIILFPDLRRVAPILFAAWFAVLGNVITVSWFLQGLEKLERFAMSAFMGRVLSVPLTFLLVHKPEDAWRAAAIQALGTIVAGVFSIYFLFRLKVVGKPDITIKGVSQQLKAGWHIFLSNASISLYTNSNIVILSAVAGVHAVGLYSGADKMRVSAQGLISPISMAVYPRISRLMHEQREEGLRFARGLLFMQGGVTFGISLVLFLASKWLVHFAMGPAFDGSVAIFRWLAWLPFFVGVSNVLGIQIMLTLGLKKSFSRIVFASGIFSGIAIYPMCLFYGAEGAAATAFFTELIVTAAMVIVLSRRKVLLFVPKRLINEL